jgi:hypothetical protein
MSGSSIARKGLLLVAYIAGTMSVTFAIGVLGAVVAQQLIASLDPSWGKRTGASSRVETALKIQAEGGIRQPVDHSVSAAATVEPVLTPGALAAAIDSAERANDEVGAQTVTGLNERTSVRAGPAVAGWRRRASLRQAASKVNADAESTARIIERSLRAEIQPEHEPQF